MEYVLSRQPVFPSKPRWFCHALTVRSRQTLKIATLEILADLGVDTAPCRERRYEQTQSIADVAHFLGFDGLIAPSARWACENLVLFTERLGPEALEVGSDPQDVDWASWRRKNRV